MNRSAFGPPTREQLLATRRRITAVSYGKRLLERKRDALLRSVEEERKAFREISREFERRARGITFMYLLLRMFEGDQSVRCLSEGMTPLPVEVQRKSVMGCRYRVFSPAPERRDTLPYSLPFDPAVTSLYVEELLKSLSESEECLWRFINMKTKISAIERELARTTLKINTLEHAILPGLLAEQRRIEDILSERERQEKFIAKRMARKKQPVMAENEQQMLDTSYEIHYS